MFTLGKKISSASAAVVAASYGFKTVVEDPRPAWLPSWGQLPLGIVATLMAIVAFILWCCVAYELWTKRPSYGRFKSYVGSWHLRSPLIRTNGYDFRTLDRFLYVGHVHVGMSRLAAESCLTLSFTSFNGTPHCLTFATSRGNIGCELSDKGKETLPSPQFKGLYWSDPVDPFREFVIEFDQYVSITKAAEIQAALDIGSGVALNFQNFSILMRSANKPTLQGKLPIWHGTTLTRMGKIIHSARSIHGAINIKI